MSVSQDPRNSITTEEAAAIELIDPADFNAGLLPIRGLSAAALRTRFGQEREWRREMLGDQQFEGMDADSAAGYRQASVLIPIVVGASLSLLLTQRTSHLNSHAGQISFPGGRAEDRDADPIDTALREAAEEIGLSRDCVEVIGRLPKYCTVSRYAVTPVVALIHPPFELVADPNEVAEAFEVPLAFLMTPAHHQRHVFEFAGGRREFLSMPWPRPDGQGDYFIWGATAAMLRNFYRLLAA